MPNEENKNEEIIDYKEFLQKKKKGIPEGEIPKVEIPKKEKKFSFAAFRDFWSRADKRTKIELIVFLMVVVLIVGILVFYLIQLKTRSPQVPLYAPPAEEKEILGH